jgi:hypothetical protein
MGWDVPGADDHKAAPGLMDRGEYAVCHFPAIDGYVMQCWYQRQEEKG